MLKNVDVFGYVKTIDGTEFEIRERKKDFNNRLKKLKKIVEASNDSEEHIFYLYQAGSYYGPEDVLSFHFVFDEDTPQTTCDNFLTFLKYTANLSSVLSNSKFNQYLLSQIINNKEKYLTPSVIRELISEHDIYNFKEFIADLPTEYKVVLFTENPTRTKENLAQHKETINSLLKTILEHNLNNEFMFGYRELNILEKNELTISFINLNKNYFDGTLDFNSLKNNIFEKLEDAQYNNLQKIDDYNYIVSSINKNNDGYNSTQIIEDYKTKIASLETENNNILNKQEMINNLFSFLQSII